MAWGCCGVALIAVLPIWRAPVATPAGRLLFFEALLLSKIRGGGGRWWCGRADLSFCHHICVLLCGQVEAQPSGSDALLWLLCASRSWLCYLLLSFPLMDQGNGQQGIFTRSCFPSSLGSADNNSPSVCGSRGAWGLPACCLAVWVAGWRARGWAWVNSLHRGSPSLCSGGAVALQDPEKAGGEAQVARVPSGAGLIDLDLTPMWCHEGGAGWGAAVVIQLLGWSLAEAMSQ